jgi:zona occludens toxin (predicted ATPase)
MIELYTGTPGSGKSLHLSKLIYMRLRQKRPVVGNFPISYKGKNEYYYIEVDNVVLADPNDLIDFALGYWKAKECNPIEGHITLIIDEAQILFNSRTWNDSKRKEWIKFFTQHRKLGFNVVLVAQFDMMLDKQLRSLIEYQTIHRKVSNFGIFGFFFAFIFANKLHVAVKIWYPIKKKTDSSFFLARKKWYSLYDTYAIFETN